MMARFMSLSQPLSRLSVCRRSFVSSNSPPPSSPSSLLHNLRFRSDQPAADAQHDADADAVEPTLALRQLDDAIQLIVVRRSAPDWLPFVPGSSYWVPSPRKSHSQAIADILSKIENSLNKEESLSLTTVRGWPSSGYFIDSAFPSPSVQGRTSDNASSSEDDEG